ncbi:MAG: Na+/H+ antiporter NhaA [Alphaproteobacteria bacterium]|nr:Na+/H+ antiporter NhaA [Alphaproteobacteria bacterium]
MASGRLHRFLHSEAAPGIVLIAVAALAIILANSPLHATIDRLFATKFTISYGELGLSKPLVLWINDGLMAIFFLLVGLEIKREVVEGALSKPAQVAMPMVAALGGMVVPAAIFAWFNVGDAVALRGWAVPAATDIAFAVGVLAVLGSRVPLGLKLFLVTLAIIDDLGAIVIIAIFYTAELSTTALVLAAICIVTMLTLNRLGVRRSGPYLLVGAVLWVCVLKSGVHATLAGVVIAFCLPLRDESVAPDDRPFIVLEHALKPWVSFLIMPLFALANAGLPLAGLSVAALLEPVPLGIALGLFLGKQIGVFLPAAAFILLRLAPMPAGGTWLKLYGVSVCAGIGFTMSLFIGSLAWDDPAYATPLRLGVLVGSLASAALAFIVINLTHPKASSSLTTEKDRSV